MQNRAYLIIRVKIESHKIWNLGSSLCFSKVILIALICHAEQ